MSYVSEAQAYDRWGQPCKVKLKSIDFCGRRISVNKKAVRAFRAMRRVMQTQCPKYAKKIAISPDTGCYNCRHIGNDSSRPWSNHSWAFPVDIRWSTNGYGLPGGSSELWQEAKAFITWCERTGIFWGGRWNTPDPMHFEIGLTPAEIKARWTRWGKSKKRKKPKNRRGRDR